MGVDQQRLCVGAEQEAVKFGRHVCIYTRCMKKVQKQNQNLKQTEATNLERVISKLIFQVIKVRCFFATAKSYKITITLIHARSHTHRYTLSLSSTLLPFIEAVQREQNQIEKSGDGGRLLEPISKLTKRSLVSHIRGRCRVVQAHTHSFA